VLAKKVEVKKVVSATKKKVAPKKKLIVKPTVAKKPVAAPKKVEVKKTAKAAPVKKITAPKTNPQKVVAPPKAIKPLVNKSTESKTKVSVKKSETKKVNQPVNEEVIKTPVVAGEKAEKTRYSDEELQEFKEIILKKLEEARRDLELLTEAYSNNAGQDINDTSPTFKILEEGSQVLSKEENSQLAMRQVKFISNLENALIRIENKSYGICRVTGKLISKERLKIVPHATLSMEAKLQQGKQK